MPATRPLPDHSRDALLTDFGRQTLADRYAANGEGPQDIFCRVAGAYADDDAHAARLYHYMSHLWFLPATPVLTNGGLDSGLPISCYLNGVDDTMEGIVETWNENVKLGSNGGGIGTYWGGVRSAGELIRGRGKTSGIHPFIKVQDALTMAVSQGSQRRGAAAVYLDIHHPEIEEFIELRSASGDLNRKSLYLHHGVNVTDEFMHAVEAGALFGLRSPKTGEVLRQVEARSLWARLLETRLRTGEPYLIFTDNANRAMPEFQRAAGLRVRQSNLCAEIMLHAGVDQHGMKRTAVCCLGSVNAEHFLTWRDEPLFILDIMRMLDNVLSDFIDKALVKGLTHAAYSAAQERSVGLGLMGFHSFLQAQGVAFDGLMARSWNKNLFTHLRMHADLASQTLAVERGPCPDAAHAGEMERFAHKMAVAPTASISIICGGTSAGIDPIPANVYSHKTASGTFQVRNPALEVIVENEANTRRVNEDWTAGQADEWLEAQWASMLEHDGSVQHLDWLSFDQKEVFRTEFEVDQLAIVQMAADRAPKVCQSQSINLFLPGDVDKWDLHSLHWKAWKDGVKSLYYLRSMSVVRGVVDTGVKPLVEPPAVNKYETCQACQ